MLLRKRALMAAICGLATFGFGSAGAVTTQAASTLLVTGAPPVTFTHEVTVDPQRLAGEPDIAISNQGVGSGKEMYVSAPWGFSTTISLAWKSEDGGAQWDSLHGSCPANPMRPFCSRGGGDTEIQLGSPQGTSTHQAAFYADLNGLDTLSCAWSTDGGSNFTLTGPATTTGQACNVGAANTPGSDRQWIAVWPAANNGTANDKLVMVYDTGESPPGDDSALNSTDGGHTWNSACNLCIKGSGFGTRPGPVLVNKSNGVFYQFLGTSGASSFSAEVNISCDLGATWSHVQFGGPSTGSTTNDFVSPAIDSAGGLYAVWSVAPSSTTLPWTTYYSHSTDPQGTSGVGNCASSSTVSGGKVQGASWSAPIKLNGPTTSAPEVTAAVMPWIAAGDSGRVDVAYYGATTTLPHDFTAETTPNPLWSVYMAQALDGQNSTPTFTTALASETPMHGHSICFNGISCTGTGDRNLSDFFEIQADPAGRAVITYTDDNNSAQGPPGAGFNGGPLVAVVQQAGGPSLFNATPLVTGPTASLTQSTGLTNTVTDPTGDALLPAHQPAPGGNVAAADITSATMTPKDSSTLAVKIKVGNFGGNPTSAIVGNHTGAIWLVTWHQGNDFWFASASTDPAGNRQYLAGKPVSVRGSGSPKALQYTSDPTGGNTTVSGSFDTAANTVEIDVPVSAVGSPTSGTILYGLTAFTGDSAAAVSTPTVGSGSVAFFDSIDQTPAIDYAVDLTSVVVPEVPSVLALVAVGALIAGGGLVVRRRRRRTPPPGP